jgi:transcriptional regulator with XRE-family HTH domain
MKSQEQIGKKLKKARQELGLTQAEVAEAVELHVNYYARVERGEETPSMKTFKAIFKVLKVKSSDIFDF